MAAGEEKGPFARSWRELEKKICGLPLFMFAELMERRTSAQESASNAVFSTLRSTTRHLMLTLNTFCETTCCHDHNACQRIFGVSHTQDKAAIGTIGALTDWT